MLVNRASKGRNGSENNLVFPTILEEISEL